LLISSIGPAASAEKGLIKMGMLMPFSGPTAGTAKDGKLAMDMFLEKSGGKIAGRPVEIIVEDSGGQPKVALEKARKLVESDKVHLITGVALSHEALAIRDYVVNNKTPTIISLFAGTTALCFGKKSDYILRTSLVNGMQALGAARYATETLRYKKFIIMGEDYVAGREKGLVFKNIVLKNGGEVVQEIFTPIGTKDYASYLTQLKEADALFAFYQPGDGLRFLKQYAGFGIKDRLPVLTTAGMVNSVTLPAVGDPALGVMMANHLAPKGAFPDRPEYVQFAQDFEAKYGHEPQDGAIQCMTGIQVISRALEAVNGDVENALAFLSAAKKVRFEALHSPFRIEPENNSVSQNVRVVRFVKKDGKMDFETLHIFEDVGATDIAPFLKKR